MLKISIFPPKSILEAIANSPLSLQIDTANSVKIDIPVTFNSILIKLLLIFNLPESICIKFINSDSLSTAKKISLFLLL